MGLIQSKYRYNSLIPSLIGQEIMQITNRVIILDFLPIAVREALEDYGVETGLSPDQVVELAIINFLDVDAVTFPEQGLKTLAQLKEENAILKLKLKAAGLDADD
jgi:hypothetical protein